MSNLGSGDLALNFTVKLSNDSYTDVFGANLMGEEAPYNDVLENLTVYNAQYQPDPSYFGRMVGLKNVTLTNLNSIYGSLFCQCISLENVNLPDTTTINSYQYSVFYGCGDFNLNLPKLKSMTTYALRLNGLKKISLPNLKKINNCDMPFFGCIALETLELPNLVTVGKNFYSEFDTNKCNTLETLELPRATLVEENAFMYANVKNISLPKAMIISSYSFFGGDTLESVSLPSIQDITERSFFCSPVKEINIPKAEVVAEYAFFMCNNLESVTLPSVVEVYDYAFMQSDIKNINLPKAETIGEYAFFDCSNLENVSLPAVKDFDDNGFTFAKCYSLNNVEFGDNLNALPQYAFMNSGLERITLPAGAKFGNYLFLNCVNLKEVDFEDGVTELGWFMFNRCTSLEKVTLPETLETVSWAAFKDCPKLTKISIPSSVKTIDDDAFAFYDYNEKEQLVITLYGTPEIITKLDEESFMEKRPYMDSYYSSTDENQKILDLLPIPDGSKGKCLTEASYENANNYKTNHAPNFELELIDFNVNVTTTENGTISTDKKTALFGDVVTVTPKANKGYNVGKVKYGDTEIEPKDGVYSFTMPDKDVEVSATFELKKFNVTWKNEDGTVIKTDVCNYGTTPKYDGKTPTKATDAQYS